MGLVYWRAPSRMAAAILVVAALGLLSGCNSVLTPTPVFVPTPLRIAYSDLAQPAMEMISPIYGEEEPSVSLETPRLAPGEALDRLPLAQDSALITAGIPAGAESLWHSPFAVDGLAMVVHPSNPIKGLALSQIQSVFDGTDWLWSQVGGSDVEIELVTLSKGSAGWNLFKDMVMGDREVSLTAVVVPDAAAVIDRVAASPGAIGYLAAAAVSSGVKSLAVDGINPEPEELAQARYPLSYQLVLTAQEEPTGPLRAFAAWLLSRDGQAVISRKYGRVR